MATSGDSKAHSTNSSDNNRDNDPRQPGRDVTTSTTTTTTNTTKNNKHSNNNSSSTSSGSSTTSSRSSSSSSSSIRTSGNQTSKQAPSCSTTTSGAVRSTASALPPSNSAVAARAPLNTSTTTNISISHSSISNTNTTTNTTSSNKDTMASTTTTNRISHGHSHSPYQHQHPHPHQHPHHPQHPHASLGRQQGTATTSMEPASIWAAAHQQQQLRQQQQQQQQRSTKPAAAVNPTDFDVLFGRGKPYQKHLGNLQLHRYTNRFKQMYVTFKDSTKTDSNSNSNSNATPEKETTFASKQAIVDEVIRLVKAGRGRFLKRNEEGGYWQVVGDTEARSKVAHILRGKPRKVPDIDPLPPYLRSPVEPLLSPTTATTTTTAASPSPTKSKMLFSAKRKLPTHNNRPSEASFNGSSNNNRQQTSPTATTPQAATGTNQVPGTKSTKESTTTTAGSGSTTASEEAMPAPQAKDHQDSTSSESSSSFQKPASRSPITGDTTPNSATAKASANTSDRPHKKRAIPASASAYIAAGTSPSAMDATSNSSPEQQGVATLPAGALFQNQEMAAARAGMPAPLPSQFFMSQFHHPSLLAASATQPQFYHHLAQHPGTTMLSHEQQLRQQQQQQHQLASTAPGATAAASSIPINAAGFAALSEQDRQRAILQYNQRNVITITDNAPEAAGQQQTSYISRQLLDRQASLTAAIASQYEEQQYRQRAMAVGQQQMFQLNQQYPSMDRHHLNSYDHFARLSEQARHQAAPTAPSYPYPLYPTAGRVLQIPTTAGGAVVPGMSTAKDTAALIESLLIQRERDRILIASLLRERNERSIADQNAATENASHLLQQQQLYQTVHLDQEESANAASVEAPDTTPSMALPNTNRSAANLDGSHDEAQSILRQMKFSRGEQKKDRGDTTDDSEHEED